MSALLLLLSHSGSNSLLFNVYDNRLFISVSLSVMCFICLEVTGSFIKSFFN